MSKVVLSDFNIIEGGRFLNNKDNIRKVFNDFLSKDHPKYGEYGYPGYKTDINAIAIDDIAFEIKDLELTEDFKILGDVTFTDNDTGKSAKSLYDKLDNIVFKIRAIHTDGLIDNIITWDIWIYGPK